MILKRSYVVIPIFFFILILSGKTALFPDESEHKWVWLNGDWVVQDSRIIEKKGFINPWNYFALLDNNSIISKDYLNKLSSIEFSIAVTNEPFEKDPKKNRPLGTPQEAMASFAIRSPSKQWNYHLYALRLSGDIMNINKVSLIYSDRIDQSKIDKKFNYFVKELAAKDTTLDYNKEHKIKIVFIKNSVEFFINGNSVLKSNVEVSGDNFDGKVAFSSKNIYIKIGDVKVSGDKGILLEDNFSSNTLLINTKTYKRANKK